MTFKGWYTKKPTNQTRKHSKFLEKSWRLKETCCHSDFSERPFDNTREKNSQGKKDKNLDLARVLQIWSMKVTVTPVVIGALRTIP